MKSHLPLNCPDSGSYSVLRVFKNWSATVTMLTAILVFLISQVFAQAPVKLLKDTNTKGDGFMIPSKWVFFKGYYYFAAYGDLQGVELWRSDGAPGGTSLFKEVLPGAFGGEIYITAINDMLYFVTNPGAHAALWQSDGTPEGTEVVEDILVQGRGTEVLDFAVVNGNIMVLAYGNGKRQWQAFAPSAGVFFACTDVAALFSWDAPMYVSTDGTYGIFYWQTSAAGIEPWRTDGTPIGTALLKDVVPGTANGAKQGSKPMFIGNTILFETTQGVNQLWRSNGTEAGTRALTCNGSCPTQFSSYTVSGNTLYMAAYDSEHAWALYKTDGNNLQFLNDPLPGNSQNGGSFGLVAMGGNILYLNNSDGQANEIWAMNEASGEHQKILTNTSIGFTAGVVAGDRYYFVNNGSYTTGSELWASDGTASGTNMLREVVVGPGGVTAPRLFSINGSVYLMSGNEGGDVIWRATNGVLKSVANAPGTVKDLFPAGASMILNVDNSPTYGDEYFYYDLADEPSVTPPVAQTITFDMPDTTLLSDAPFRMVAVASSGLPVTLDILNEFIVNRDGDLLTPLRAGTIVITAKQAGNNDFGYVEAQHTVVIAKVPQQITFTLPSTAIVGDVPLKLSATATSGLPVQYSSNDLNVFIEYGEITFVAPGTATIVATQPGDDLYQPADAVSVTVAVVAVLGVENGLGVFKAYPNPTTDVLTIESPRPVKDIALVDLYGKAVSASRTSPTTLSLAGLSPGVYVVVISGDSFGPVQMKVIKK